MDNQQLPIPDELKDKIKDSELERYENSFNDFKMIPEHEFEHKALLIDIHKTGMNPTALELISKEVLLANIDDDHLLRIYQLQLANIMEWHDMNLWDSVGKFMYAKFIGELSLSRSRGSMERLFQAGAIPVLSRSKVRGLGDFFRSKKKEEYEAQQAQQNQTWIQREGGAQYG